MNALTNLPRKFADGAAFAKAISDAIRADEKNNGHAWHYWEGEVTAGTHTLAVTLKTWRRSGPQILTVDGVRYGGALDIKVGDFIALLERATTRKTYTVTVNDVAIHEGTDKVQAERLAESAWQRGRGHTKVIDENGAIVAEFEI